MGEAGEARRLFAVSPMSPPTPRDYAAFEAQPFIHSVLKGAVDGVEGVGILTQYEWLPPHMEGNADVWGDTWVIARANWMREIKPRLLLEPRNG